MNLFAPAAPPPAAPPSDPAEVRALLALGLVPGVGPGRIRALVARFGSAEAVWRAPATALAQTEGVGRGTARAIARWDAWAEVEALAGHAARVGAWALTLADARYPALLRQIYDPPPLLWVRGELRPEDADAVAVVGTRRATDYGRRLAQEWARELAARGVTVVSGLAYGIDAAAHRGALEAGRTLAVLGSGIDRIYPGRHAALARQIMDGGGAVLTEFAPGTAPDAPNFPRRNRIVSGLALGTLVVEAHETGGALLTAYQALEQNREVFAVPGAVMSDASVGCHRLIQRGLAKLVVDVDDVLAEIAPHLRQAAAPAPPAPELNGVERKLYDALGAEPVHLDVLCERAGVEPSSALVYLLSLEFKGAVRQLAGKQFFRA